LLHDVEVTSLDDHRRRQDTCTVRGDEGRRAPRGEQAIDECRSDRGLITKQDHRRIDCRWQGAEADP